MKILSSTPRYQFNPGIRQLCGKALVLPTFIALMFSAPVFADDAADVNKLLRAGQFAEALNKTDAFLVKNPRDKQMRFLKGIILTEQNRNAEAITLFTKLTEDFPDLPEPYNNLAVLFASTGQYDKARTALDMAIRTNPTYATAHENLGDVYAKLASQAYDKALQLDSANSTAKSKLTMVRTLVGNTTGGADPKTVTASAATSLPAQTTAATTSKATPVPAKLPPTPTPPVTASVKPAATASAVVIAKQEPPVKAEPKPVAKPAPAPAPAPVAESNGEREEVLNVAQSWAKAWSAKDVKDYLSHYASDFTPPNGESHKAWADERRSRIEGKGHIDVKIDSPQVTLTGNTATVKFRQIYLSDRLTANSRKTLTMTKISGKWRIKQERTGN
jgi:Flp pilus assembly protein TadD/ketosteroid isomerase-like protein